MTDRNRIRHALTTAAEAALAETMAAATANGSRGVEEPLRRLHTALAQLEGAFGTESTAWASNAIGEIKCAIAEHDNRERLRVFEKHARRAAKTAAAPDTGRATVDGALLKRVARARRKRSG